MSENKICTMETEKGAFTIEFYAQAAPGTVENFTQLANDGFYDGLPLHRCIKNFVIQGGCPEGTGRGGPGYKIKCETAGNPHKHVRGALSMATPVKTRAAVILRSAPAAAAPRWRAYGLWESNRQRGPR